MSKSITEAERIVVKGRSLVYKESGDRFIMRGVAYPDPLDHSVYDPKGYIAVLQQLRDLDIAVNTVRMYSLDPSVDYSEFFNAAAELGFYIMVPLTSISGPGVLNRGLSAPDCYSKGLFQYGKRTIDAFSPFPNILGGVLANEVMNSLEAWAAAPCISAYARDLKKYKSDFPLIYTGQHDGIGAAVSPSEAMEATMEYLTCDNDSSINIFGINIESWCSSTQTFDLNDDGSIGTYKDLYDQMANATIPLIFSELGCSQELFNKDNGLERGVRDWRQVPVILNEMADEWSGFSAYAYDGPAYFQMMKGGPWNGKDILKPGKDMTNLGTVLEEWDKVGMPIPAVRGVGQGKTCEEVANVLKECCDLDLFPVDSIPSYRASPFLALGYAHGRLVASSMIRLPSLVVLVVGMSLLFLSIRFFRRQTKREAGYEPI